MPRYVIDMSRVISHYPGVVFELSLRLCVVPALIVPHSRVMSGYIVSDSGWKLRAKDIGVDVTHQDVLLIHGTWGHGHEWDDFGAALTSRGFTVHAPNLPHHGRPGDINIWSAAQQVSKLGLRDYVDAMVDLVRRMDTPPIIIGHSLGGLIAQLVAARINHAGLVLLAPAPAAGIFALYPAEVMLWGRYLSQILLARPMYPVSRKVWNTYIGNTSSTADNDRFYQDHCAESGRVYRQMVFWMFDRSHSSRVDFAQVTGPILTLVGQQDRCVIPAMVASTTSRYGSRAKMVELPGADHMLIAGDHMQATLAGIDTWLATHGLSPAT